MTPEIADLPALDRDVRRAAEKLEAWRKAPSVDRDPFADLRHVTTQATYRAVLAHPATMGESLHRDALARWIHELLQARIGLDLEAEEAERIAAPDPRVGVGDAGKPITFAEAWTDVVRGGDAKALSELSDPVLAVRRERRLRRDEAMRRLDLVPPTSALAQALFDATENFSRDLLQNAIKRKEGQWHANDAIVLAHARDAREGWPAQLLPRWLDEIFAPLGRAPVASLEEPLGGATFLRAAGKWGFSRRQFGTPRSLPFALARDPYSLPAHRFAFACASALAEPVFGRKVLGLPARLASAQSRALQTSLFLGARTLAARVLIANGADVEEITTRLFGAPFFAAWPNVRIDDHARVAAVLDTTAFVGTLVRLYDDDWFRNPRAGSHLSNLAAGPAFDDTMPAPESAAALARFFEQALG